MNIKEVSLKKIILLTLLLASGTAFAFSDFLICFRILQSNSLPDRESLETCQQMKKSLNFSKFPNCVMSMNRQTSLTIVESVDFCIEIDANETKLRCVLKSNKHNYPEVTDAINFCLSK